MLVSQWSQKWDETEIQQGESRVDSCAYFCRDGDCCFSSWRRIADAMEEGYDYEGGFEELDEDGIVVLILDLDEGKLILVTENDEQILLKDGLSGVYSWFASVQGPLGASVSIKRGDPSL